MSIILHYKAWLTEQFPSLQQRQIPGSYEDQYQVVVVDDDDVCCALKNVREKVPKKKRVMMKERWTGGGRTKTKKRSRKKKKSFRARNDRSFRSLLRRDARAILDKK